MKKLYDLVIVDYEYCDYLRQFDNRVSYNAKEKELRPFVGVLFEIDAMKYFAPLSSPKQKHLKMKNDIDFYKLSNGKLGAINFNNMIPVPDGSYTLVDTKTQGLTSHEQQYKALLRNQLRWLNRDGKKLRDIAYNLYINRIHNTLPFRVQKRCCDFRLLEEKCNEYKK